MLLVDLDPQAALSVSLRVPVSQAALTVYQVLLGQALAGRAVRATYAGADLNPANIDLAAAELELAAEIGRERVLSEALQPLSERYDFILIDCPPSLGILTLNAFAAADGVLVPLQCEYYALEGISMLNRVMTQLHDSGVNPRLELLGVVMTMYDGRTRLCPQVVSEVREYFGEKVFETQIPRTTRLAEAPSFGKPIIHYDKYSSGSAAYELLAQEFLARIETLASSTAPGTAVVS